MTKLWRDEALPWAALGVWGGVFVKPSIFGLLSFDDAGRGNLHAGLCNPLISLLQHQGLMAASFLSAPPQQKDGNNMPTGLTWLMAGLQQRLSLSQRRLGPCSRSAHPALPTPGWAWQEKSS